MRKTLEISELIASIESVGIAMHIHTKFSIAYWRDPNMAVSFNATGYSEGWKAIGGDTI